MSSKSDLINGRNYNISDIAKWFHNLNHLNYKLERIKNSTFDIQNEEYQISVLVFVLLPLLVLVLILLVYLIYSICICICGTAGKTGKYIRVEWRVFIFLFGLVCSATFIVGLYGSWKIHGGVHSLHNSTEDAINLFNSIKNDGKNISNVLNIEHDINNIKKNIEPIKPSIPENFYKFLDEILRYSREAKHRVDEANDKLTKLDIQSVPEQIEKYENIRWIVSLSVLCVLAILGFVFTFGIYCRCVLTLFTIFAVISLILCSALVAVTFGVSVALSDFCYDAKPFIKSQMNGMIEAKIADYYIDCLGDESPISNLLEQALIKLNDSMNVINQFEAIHEVIDQVCHLIPNCPTDIQKNLNESTADLKNKLISTKQLIDDISKLADCHRVNNDLNESLNSICTDIIEGIAMILSNGIAASFCFIVLVFCSTYALK